MQFIPICLECENFITSDKCKIYGVPPFEIKNRETKCPHFTGGEYDLFTKESHIKKTADNKMI